VSSLVSTASRSSQPFRPCSADGPTRALSEVSSKGTPIAGIDSATIAKGWPAFAQISYRLWRATRRRFRRSFNKIIARSAADRFLPCWIASTTSKGIQIGSPFFALPMRSTGVWQGLINARPLARLWRKLRPSGRLCALPQRRRIECKSAPSLLR
jgi:hypothetical protein